MHSGAALEYVIIDFFLKVNKKSANSRVQTKPIKHHSENQVVEISDERCQVLRKKSLHKIIFNKKDIWASK